MAKFVVLLPVGGYWVLALVLGMAPQGAQMLILTTFGPPLAIGAFVILLPERHQRVRWAEVQEERGRAGRNVSERD